MKTIIISIGKAVCIQACIAAMLQAAVSAQFLPQTKMFWEKTQEEREIESRLEQVESRLHGQSLESIPWQRYDP